MARKLITIDVNKTDKTFSVHTEGFQGNGCGAIQKAFEEMGTITEEKLQPGPSTGPGQCTTLTAGR